MKTLDVNRGTRSQRSAPPHPTIPNPLEPHAVGFPLGTVSQLAQIQLQQGMFLLLLVAA